MWFGKFVIISYVFCGLLLIVAFMMFRFFGFSLYDSDTLTEGAMTTLIGTNDVSVTPNTNFIFGDPIATIQAIGTILFQSVTGGVVGDALTSIPYINADVTFGYIFQFIFTFSQAMLIIAWIANREA